MKIKGTSVEVSTKTVGFNSAQCAEIEKAHSRLWLKRPQLSFDGMIKHSKAEKYSVFIHGQRLSGFCYIVLDNGKIIEQLNYSYVHKDEMNAKELQEHIGYSNKQMQAITGFTRTAWAKTKNKKPTAIHKALYKHIKTLYDKGLLNQE